MTWLIALLGVATLVLGGWLAADPDSSPAAAFPPLNEHLIHDSAAAFLTFGIALLVAARVPSWRLPVLVVAALWNGLHAVSHVVDVDRAATRSAGIWTAVELSAVTVILALLALWSRRPSQ
jgi:hypothetical protein